MVYTQWLTATLLSFAWIESPRSIFHVPKWNIALLVVGWPTWSASRKIGILVMLRRDPVSMVQFWMNLTISLCSLSVMWRSLMVVLNWVELAELNLLATLFHKLLIHGVWLIFSSSDQQSLSHFIVHIWVSQGSVCGYALNEYSLGGELSWLLFIPSPWIDVIIYWTPQVSKPALMLVSLQFGTRSLLCCLLVSFV